LERERKGEAHSKFRRGHRSQPFTITTRVILGNQRESVGPLNEERYGILTSDLAIDACSEGKD